MRISQDIERPSPLDLQAQSILWFGPDHFMATKDKPVIIPLRRGDSRQGHPGGNLDSATPFDARDNRPRTNTIELAQFLYGEFWGSTEKVLVNVCDLNNSLAIDMKLGAARQAVLGKQLASVYRSAVSGYHRNDEYRYRYMERCISKNPYSETRIEWPDVHDTLSILRQWADTQFRKENHAEPFQQFIATIKLFEYVDKHWNVVPTFAPDTCRGIKLMKLLYDNEKWEFTRMALEWGRSRAAHPEMMDRLCAEGGKLVEEYRRRIATYGFEERDGDQFLQNCLDGDNYDINEADVKVTMDIFQTWWSYMNDNETDIEKMADEGAELMED